VRRTLQGLTLCLALALAAAAGADTFRCDDHSIVTLAGADTQEGRLLLRSADGWWIETRPDAVDPGGGDWNESATYHAESADRPYGLSVGPGPIFGVTGCGDGCLQAQRWAASTAADGGEAGSWAPLGEPITGVPAGAAHATYDLSGAPWVIVQTPPEPGEGSRDSVRAHAWRFADGAWASAGSALVRSAGAAAAVPDPRRGDAILSGSVRFAVGERPASWVATLPSLSAEEVGVLVPVGDGAAYLTAEGRLLLSRDGERWVRSRWSPWGKNAERLWHPGRDYTVDLPTADRRGELNALWIDRREGSAGRMTLITWDPTTDWQALAEADAEIKTLDGTRLPYAELVVARPGVWVLIAGCVNTANGPGLVLRTYGGEGLTRPRFLPLRPGG